MSSARYRLIEILKRQKRLRKIDSNACRNILATTREVLEADKSKDVYTVTNLYCNWSLHNQISQSMAALRTLEAISQRCMQLIKGNMSSKQFIQYFSQEALRPNILRSELIQLCQHLNIKNFLFSKDHNWNIFLALILGDMIDKPIMFPQDSDIPASPSDSPFLKKSKTMYQSLFDALQGDSGRIFRKAWISLDIDPWDSLPEPERKPIFHCNIECFNQVTFKIKMTNVQKLPFADEYEIDI